MISITILTVYGLVSLLRNKTTTHSGAQTVLHKHQYLREGVIGFGLGWLVGMFGILFATGRLITVMNAFKIGPKVVVGTGASISCVLGLTAFAGHAFFGNVNFLLFFVLASTGMTGGISWLKTYKPYKSKKVKDHACFSTLVYNRILACYTC